MSRFDKDGNYIEPKFGLDDGAILFDANYGRTGRIEAKPAVCYGCGLGAPCLVTDQSEGEYHAAQVCRECIAKIFESIQL